VARREAARESDEGYFATMTLEELQAAKDPLSYIAESSDRLGQFDDALSVGAKRKFLTEFWQRRDPDPATPRNEVREQFYAAVAFANENYRERGRAGRDGWRTDRGRVFARNGAPDEKVTRLASGRSPPYEVWHYTRGRGAYYVYVDPSRLDTYNLVCSNDLKETCRNDWREVLGEDAVTDIGNFLGIDFYTRANNPIDF
jgi:GWxTD domain-containing protein